VPRPDKAAPPRRTGRRGSDKAPGAPPEDARTARRFKISVIDGHLGHEKLKGQVVRKESRGFGNEIVYGNTAIAPELDERKIEQTVTEATALGFLIAKPCDAV
jgi:hypothetical protein